MNIVGEDYHSPTSRDFKYNTSSNCFQHQLTIKQNVTFFLQIYIFPIIKNTINCLIAHYLNKLCSIVYILLSAKDTNILPHYYNTRGPLHVLVVTTLLDKYMRRILTLSLLIHPPQTSWYLSTQISQCHSQLWSLLLLLLSKTEKNPLSSQLIVLIEKVSTYLVIGFDEHCLL
mgnify:FL=1